MAKSNSQRRRKRAFWSLTLICALAYLPSLRHVMDGAWPFSEDAMAAFGVWREFTRGTLARGVLPLWNPHLFCGMPFISNGQTSVLYPPNLIYWFLPIRCALLLDAFAHHLFLTFGAYAFARALRLSRTAAWFVAVSLALSGFVAAHLFNGHMTWHAARAYLPWELWALLCYLRTGQRRYAYAWVICFALQFASGYPPVVVLSVAWCGGLVLAWLLACLWPRLLERRTATLSWPAGWGQTAFYCGVLACLLAAVCLLPLREVSSLAVHGRALPYALASTDSGNWHSLARFFVPEFFGNNHPFEWSLQAGAHEEAAYCGLLAIILALGAPFLAQRINRANATDKTSAPSSYLPRAVFCLWPILPFTALMAMGDNTAFYPWFFHHLAPLRLMRVPVRWLETGSFAAILLAGFGFDSCLHRPPPEHDKTSSQWLALSFGMLTLLLAGVWLFVATTSPHSALWTQTAQWNNPQTGTLQIAVAQTFRAEAIAAALRAWGLALSITLLLALWAWASSALKRRRIEKLLLGLVVFDMLGLFWRSDKYIAPVALNSFVRWPAQLTRLYYPGERWNTHMFSLEAMNQAMPLGIDLVNGYDTMGTRRYFRFAAACKGHAFWTAAYQPETNSPLWRVAGLTQTLTQDTNSTGGGVWHLVPSHGAWPRIYLTRRLIRQPDATQLNTLAKVAAQPFIRQNPVAIVAPDAFTNVVARPLATGERILHWQRDLNEMQLVTQTRAPAVVAQSEAWYPGWRAWVNGRAVPLERVNFLFRGVEVPAGAATVRVVYDPATYQIGLFLTLCGLTTLMAIVSRVFHCLDRGSSNSGSQGNEFSSGRQG